MAPKPVGSIAGAGGVEGAAGCGGIVSVATTLLEGVTTAFVAAPVGAGAAPGLLGSLLTGMGHLHFKKSIYSAHPMTFRTFQTSTTQSIIYSLPIITAQITIY